MITAETQLEGAQSQQINVGVTRASSSTPSRCSIGKPPADFSLAAGKARRCRAGGSHAACRRALLERRPDIAQAERKMAAANAQIGVAIAAYFPDLTLQRRYGFSSSVISHLVSAPNNLWSFGGTSSDDGP